MKLYGLTGACSFVPHVALEWVKLRANQDYAFQAVSREFIKSAEYLALNPRGNVPLLVDGDLALTQNQAIVHYLDELYPEAKLFGSKTARDKAKAARWLAFFNSDVLNHSCHCSACQVMRKAMKRSPKLFANNRLSKF